MAMLWAKDAVNALQIASLILIKSLAVQDKDYLTQETALKKAINTRPAGHKKYRFPLH
jgi:hypothetical protein